MEDKMWSFLQNFLLRIFTLNIFKNALRAKHCILVGKYAHNLHCFILLCKTVDITVVHKFFTCKESMHFTGTSFMIG